MFFETSDFDVKGISVFKLGWQQSNAVCKVRPYHALSFRILGDAVFSYDDGQMAVKTGDILFVPAHFMYRINAKEEKLFVIHFYSETPLPQNIKRFSAASTEYYKQRFEEIYKVWSKKQVGYEHECQSLLHRIFMHIERDLEKDRQTDHGAEISEALERIHNDFTNKDLSIGELANCCRMSETYFRKMFLKLQGTSPLEYINKLKLDYAVELLRSGYYTVGEASDKCGFSSPYYFSAFIKKQTGHSPIDYIKNRL